MESQETEESQCLRKVENLTLHADQLAVALTTYTTSQLAVVEAVNHLRRNLEEQKRNNVEYRRLVSVSTQTTLCGFFYRPIFPPSADKSTECHIDKGNKNLDDAGALEDGLIRVVVSERCLQQTRDLVRILQADKELLMKSLEEKDKKIKKLSETIERMTAEKEKDDSAIIQLSKSNTNISGEKVRSGSHMDGSKDNTPAKRRAKADIVYRYDEDVISGSHMDGSKDNTPAKRRAKADTVYRHDEDVRSGSHMDGSKDNTPAKRRAKADIVYRYDEDDSEGSIIPMLMSTPEPRKGRYSYPRGKSTKKTHK